MTWLRVTTSWPACRCCFCVAWYDSVQSPLAGTECRIQRLLTYRMHSDASVVNHVPYCCRTGAGAAAQRGRAGGSGVFCALGGSRGLQTRTEVDRVQLTAARGAQCTLPLHAALPLPGLNKSSHGSRPVRSCPASVHVQPQTCLSNHGSRVVDRRRPADRSPAPYPLPPPGRGRAVGQPADAAPRGGAPCASALAANLPVTHPPATRGHAALPRYAQPHGWTSSIPTPTANLPGVFDFAPHSAPAAATHCLYSNL